MLKGSRCQRSDRSAPVKVSLATGILGYVSFLLFLVMLLGPVPLGEGQPLKGAE